MKAVSKSLILSFLGIACSVALFSTVTAAEGEKDNPTKAFMKKYHKAPKGVDPVCKRATMGTATPQELKELAAGYKAMTMAKPPRGDEAAWKAKTTKLASAAEAMVKGDPEGAARYKEALNCKACHSDHKPE